MSITFFYIELRRAVSITRAFSRVRRSYGMQWGIRCVQCNIFMTAVCILNFFSTPSVWNLNFQWIRMRHMYKVSILSPQAAIVMRTALEKHRCMPNSLINWWQIKSIGPRSHAHTERTVVYWNSASSLKLGPSNINASSLITSLPYGGYKRLTDRKTENCLPVFWISISF